MNTWNSNTHYDANEVVEHNGKVYQKLDDNDQTEPDSIGGGWVELQNTNLQQYELIEASFNSYEQRKAQHQAAVKAAKASAEAKLAALGLTKEELQALGL